MNSSSFNKKKWLKNHLNEILQLKKQGLTHLAIIQSLKKQQKMPFDLTESLLSRYLKEFSSDEKTTLKTKMALDHKIERQNRKNLPLTHRSGMGIRCQRERKTNLYLCWEQYCG